MTPQAVDTTPNQNVSAPMIVFKHGRHRPVGGYTSRNREAKNPTVGRSGDTLIDSVASGKKERPGYEWGPWWGADGASSPAFAWGQTLFVSGEEIVSATLSEANTVPRKN